MNQDSRIEIPIVFIGDTFAINDLSGFTFPATGYYDVTGSGTLSGNFDVTYSGTLTTGLRATFFYNGQATLAGYNLTFFGRALTQQEALNACFIQAEYNGSAWIIDVLQVPQINTREGVTTFSPASPYAGGTTTLQVGLSNRIYEIAGTVTMSGNYTVTTNNTNAKNGDSFAVPFNGTWTRSGNTLSIFGINCDAYADAGQFVVYTAYNGSAWISWVVLGAGQMNNLWVAGAGTNSMRRKAYTAAVASGNGSLNIGDNTTVASGTNALASGSGTTASGNFSATLNKGTTASGVAATAMGSGGYATGVASLVLGTDATAARTGQVAHSNVSLMSSAGTLYSQKSEVLASTKVTDATATVLLLSWVSGFVTIAANSTVRVRGSVTAVQVAGGSGTVGDCATWDFWVTIQNLGGTTSLVDSVLYMDNTGTISTTPAQSSQVAAAAAWTLVPTADNANDALSLTFTGEANKTVCVHAEMTFNEIKYA